MPNKMGKKSDDEKNKLKERARRVIGPVTPRPVAGNKEGRASEFYKAPRPIDFLMNMFPAIPGSTGTVKIPRLSKPYLSYSATGKKKSGGR